jgi:hypothetical protein
MDRYRKMWLALLVCGVMVSRPLPVCAEEDQPQAQEQEQQSGDHQQEQQSGDHQQENQPQDSAALAKEASSLRNEADQKLQEASALMASATAEAAQDPAKAAEIMVRAQHKAAELQAEAQELTQQAEAQQLASAFQAQATSAADGAVYNSLAGLFGKGLNRLAEQVAKNPDSLNQSRMSLADLTKFLDGERSFSMATNTVDVQFEGGVLSFASGQPVILNGAAVTPEALAALPQSLSGPARFLADLLGATVTRDPLQGLILTFLKDQQPAAQPQSGLTLATSSGSWPFAFLRPWLISFDLLGKYCRDA